MKNKTTPVIAKAEVQMKQMPDPCLMVNRTWNGLSEVQMGALALGVQ